MNRTRPRYRGFVADTARWDGFAFRAGDIVISTPSKSGTTWMQMLVALLVFDGPDFPAPLNVMSPWLDMLTQPLGDVVTRLEAQRHRRFIKTHAPVEAVPWDDRATYIVVGRDPRDVSVSMWHHMENLDREALHEAVVAVAGQEHLDTLPESGVEWPETLQEQLAFDVEYDGMHSHVATHLRWIVHHLQDAWHRRNLPNVALFHYADLDADLPGELRRLADVLELDLTDGRAEELAAEASLSRMRARAPDVAPTGDQDLWKDPAGFFRRGSSGEWHDLVAPGIPARYDARLAELTTPDLAAWIAGGWRGHPEAAG